MSNDSGFAFWFPVVIGIGMLAYAPYVLVTGTEVNTLALLLSIGMWAVLFGVLVAALYTRSPQAGDDGREHSDVPSRRAQVIPVPPPQPVPSAEMSPERARAIAGPQDFTPSPTELAEFLRRAKQEADHDHGVIDRVVLSAFRRASNGTVIANGRVFPHPDDDRHWVRVFRFPAS